MRVECAKRLNITYNLFFVHPNYINDIIQNTVLYLINKIKIVSKALLNNYFLFKELPVLSNTKINFNQIIKEIS